MKALTYIERGRFAVTEKAKPVVVDAKDADSSHSPFNWHIGRMIVEAHGGEDRAAYGDQLIKNISKSLTSEYGKDFNLTNLKYMRQFYLSYPNSHTLCDQLSWSHYNMEVCRDDDNSTVGIILCAEKNDAVVRSSIGLAASHR